MQSNLPNSDSKPDNLAFESYVAYKKDSSLQQWFKDFCQNRLESNLNAFNTFFENIYNQIDNYRPLRPYELFCTADGVANLYFLDSNTCLYNKGNDAIDFSKRQAEFFLNNVRFKKTVHKIEEDPYGQLHYKYDNELISRIQRLDSEPVSLGTLKSVPLTIVLGIGLGYPIAELLEKLESRNIIIIEPDLDLFYTSLSVFDWFNLLTYAHDNNVRLSFVIGDKTDYIDLYIRHFLAHHGAFLVSGIQIFKHYSSEAITRTEKKINAVYPHLFSPGFFDDAIFGMCHTCNMLTRKNHFVVKSLKNTEFETFPVFIVGSGPSLDRSISFLRRFQDKAIIIACGTAIDSL